MFPTFLLLLASLDYRPQPDPVQVERFAAAQLAISTLNDVWEEGDLTFASWGLAVRACGEALVPVLPAASHAKATAAFDALQRCRMAGNGFLGAKVPTGSVDDWHAETRAALRALHLAVAVAIHATPGVALGVLPAPAALVIPDDPAHARLDSSASDAFVEGSAAPGTIQPPLDDATLLLRVRGQAERAGLENANPFAGLSQGECDALARAGVAT